jgi:fumarate reductase flavoprotein subunit
MAIRNPDEARFAAEAGVLIVGAGACGCVAALAAAERGASAVVLERDASPRGNTALSGGQIPAGGTQLQRAAGIDDSAEILAADILAKAKGQCDAALARHVAAESARTVDWLVERYRLPLSCLTDFSYPGHSRHHMHASPSRFGAELLAVLLAAIAESGADLVTQAHVVDLFADARGRIHGVRTLRPDGEAEDVACGTLILACNGYGGSKALLRRFIPAIAEAHYHGHAGNQGDAVLWGEALGASLKDLGSFQGHGAVCTPHVIHLGWAVISEGGFQVNERGERFSHENEGYSEQALKVAAQPGGIAWTIWDERGEQIALAMHSHQEAKAAGAIHRAATPEAIAAMIGCAPATLAATMADVAAMALARARCPWGRDFTRHPPLAPPYYAAKVMGALFHTQGGLEVDREARVLRRDGSPFPNLFAGGGAARGLSGPADWGYLSGSGLLMATTLGRIAGERAAAQAGAA